MRRHRHQLSTHRLGATGRHGPWLRRRTALAAAGGRTPLRPVRALNTRPPRVRPERAGPGRSPKRLADEVADLKALIAKIGHPVHLVGMSYGATVALHAAQPDRRFARWCCGNPRCTRPARNWRPCWASSRN
ncbi:alpha/beta fold hydrolase [Streptomyces hayashii]|uniref:alpha/beta fold hydrolase n=1 Tax=Streptomyces hayashii TaxID=2839966 RepID=UPI00403C7E6F